MIAFRERGRHVKPNCSALACAGHWVPTHCGGSAILWCVTHTHPASEIDGGVVERFGVRKFAVVVIAISWKRELQQPATHDKG